MGAAMTAEPVASFDEAVAFALTLPGTELGTSYGRPAVKLAANGRAFLSVGHEPDTSFVLTLDLDAIELLKATDPATYWQSPHYEGWPAVLVRFASPDPARVRDTIARARDWAAARPKAKPRAKASRSPKGADRLSAIPRRS
jgi:hypothetical protein